MAPADEPPVLATKLHAPRRRRGVVERPRLADRVPAGELPALTLVSAPAGFGKTTLLAQRFGAGPVDDAAGDGPLTSSSTATSSTAWLSLDAGDDDPVRFWTAVVAALQGAVAPGIGADALALQQASQPMPTVMASLLNDLAAHGAEVVLVLDDYHVIESAEVHAALAFVLDHRPPNVHLVLAGRADPPLPLARLRAAGELEEIRAADLRFTADETADYLNRVMGLDLTAGNVTTLDGRTEGWIAAIQLAALSMQGRPDPGAFIASFAGDDRFVVDYLAEEVLERQPDDVRSFLLDTAILNRLTGPLCDAVTGGGGGGGRAMLERLERANLFLVPLDDRRVWYRYHHLFADVLRARLADEAPEHLDQLHRRASAWFEAAGGQPEAIGHALAGHDPERAARLIELIAPSLFRTRQETTARRWLTALPFELFADRPVLSVALVGAQMVSGYLTDVEPLLAGIERWLEPGADLTNAIVFDHAELARLPAQTAVYRAALALIAGDVETTISHAERALGLAAPTDHLPRGSAAALVGLARWTMGDLDAGCRRYREALASLTAAGHISDVLGCSLAVADIEMTQGRLGDAIATCTAGLDLARANGVVRGTADLHVALATVLLERDDRAGAARHLDLSAELGEEGGLPQHPYRWRVTMARLRRAEGDREATLALLTEAERLYHTDMSPPVRPVSALLARARLANGDRAAAQRWVAASGLTPDDELSYVHELEHVTLGRVLAADRATADGATGGTDEATDGAGGAAVRLLERLLAAAEAGGRAGSVIEILVALALAHEAGGDHPAAVAALDRALDRAEPEGWVRVFADELPALAPVLRAVASGSGAGRARAQLVLEAGGGPAPTPSDGPAAAAAAPPSGSPRGQGLVDELSSRELDVLRLLRSDLSGPDMARELLVSLNTLRTHTRNIYTKLGVTNRREAVRRAAELGL